MIKSKTLTSRDGQNIEIIHDNVGDLREILSKNRNITDASFFTPSLSDLHDPFLMPDMELAIERILKAREQKERVVIFGDYDVDGVSSTALLYTFFTDIGIECSYRLPHRVKDGYGIKKYHFDELKEKNVRLVVTVDCGTRDIEAIAHAKSLGIDVIVTDHHAVPEVIPEGVPIVNPKRKDSKYPFTGLAGAGVAFTLVRGIVEEMKNIGVRHRDGSRAERGDPCTWIASCLAMTEKEHQDRVLKSFIDIASLGTVADCMPLVGENRVITALGLKQMKNSRSGALRKYIENLDRDIDGDADVIGFQIGPRINAAGRMDTPLKALHWLLSEDAKVDDWLEEVEGLNVKRQEAVKKFSEDALMTVNPEDPVLFYLHDDLEHGLVGLIAGKLTEAYGKPAIALCPHRDDGKREYEKDILSSRRDPFQNQVGESYGQNLLSEGENDSSTTLRNDKENSHLVASCRSPEWCNLVELLDECKEYFVRYGGHRQAAGFTIDESKYDDFKRVIREKFREKYDTKNLPTKTISVETILVPAQISLESVDMIDLFRPFGIGNRKPIFLMRDLTVREAKMIGKESNHLSLSFHELTNIKCLLWNFEKTIHLPSSGDILSPVFTLERNKWNGKESVQIMIENFLEN